MKHKPPQRAMATFPNDVLDIIFSLATGLAPTSDAAARLSTVCRMAKAAYNKADRPNNDLYPRKVKGPWFALRILKGLCVKKQVLPTSFNLLHSATALGWEEGRTVCLIVVAKGRTWAPAFTFNLYVVSREGNMLKLCNMFEAAPGPITGTLFLDDQRWCLEKVHATHVSIYYTHKRELFWKLS